MQSAVKPLRKERETRRARYTTLALALGALIVFGASSTAVRAAESIHPDFQAVYPNNAPIDSYDDSLAFRVDGDGSSIRSVYVYVDFLSYPPADVDVQVKAYKTENDFQNGQNYKRWDFYGEAYDEDERTWTKLENKYPDNGRWRIDGGSEYTDSIKLKEGEIYEFILAYDNYADIGYTTQQTDYPLLDKSGYAAFALTEEITQASVDIGTDGNLNPGSYQLTASFVNPNLNYDNIQFTVNKFGGAKGATSKEISTTTSGTITLPTTIGTSTNGKLRAYMIDTDGSAQMVSDEVPLNMATTTSFYQDAYATSTSYQQQWKNNNCNDIGITDVFRGMKCALIWSFVPRTSFVNTVNDVTNTYKDEFPISFGYRVRDNIRAVQSTSSPLSDEDFSVSVNLYQSYGSSTAMASAFPDKELPIFQWQWLVEKANADYLQPFINVARYGLYAMFFLWLFWFAVTRVPGAGSNTIKPN